jgi:uncharacterized membrane protein YoaT (DUF817 family)
MHCSKRVGNGAGAVMPPTPLEMPSLSDLPPASPIPKSAAAQWAPLARFIDADARLGRWAAQRPATLFIYEFVRFGVKQAWACLFGGAMVALIVGTALWYPRGAALARYDFLFLMAIAIQIVMLGFKLETFDEAKVILIYHIVGTIMEIFKTGVGSWIYPEASIFRVAGVPLFSGFMYASIGSYIARSWRLFDFRFSRHPPLWSIYLLSLAIYVNFFVDHYTVDLRILLFAAAALLFGRTWIYYRIHHHYRRMPLLLGLFLVALFIWIAENLGTLTRTWLYPHQMAGWSAVSLGKLGSWFLLLIISYALVAMVNRPQPVDQTALSPRRATAKMPQPRKA